MADCIQPEAMSGFSGVILDCRFSLTDAGAGYAAYTQGRIPRAHYLHLERDLSAPLAPHGGRHPLPEPGDFAATLARLGIDAATDVVVYDDASYAFAARCWWMMRALGYRQPRLLAGGYQAWKALGLTPERGEAHVEARAVTPPRVPDTWPLCCDRDGLRELQAQGARLVDAREAARYRGEVEPIDPVAGHIPGAENRPWQGLVEASGAFLENEALRRRWGDLAAADPLVVYCGSGVSACVNLFTLARLGRDDVWLYGGSWSDWCSYLS